MRAPAWLTARPIAHRGLHDRARGIIENTVSAAAAAIAGNFGIELDIQLSRDGEAMVHHDERLGRLTEGDSDLRSLTSDQLKRVAFHETSDRMMTLSELCELVAGRVPLIIELKSRFDGDTKLADRATQVLTGYRGPAALMSFDPDLVEATRHRAPQVPRGIVAQTHYDDAEWDAVPETKLRRMRHLRHAPWTRPHFIAYWVKDLPAPAPWIARNVFGCPLLTWTVRTPEQVEVARRHADQMIFEQFVPTG